LTVETVGNAHRLKNRRLHGVTLAVIDFLRDRLEVHVRAGDADAWVQKRLSEDLASSLDGPLFARLIDLVAKLEQDPEVLRQIYGLLQSLAGEGQGTAGSFPALLCAAGDLLQLFLDDGEVVPIARGVGTALHPSQLAPALKMIHRARALDPNRPEP